MSNKKKVLISGPNGFIGKNIINGLKNKIEFFEVSRKSNNKITNLSSLLKINGLDAVIHCAAKTFVPDSYKKPFDFYKFNINSTLNIAEFCRKKKIKKIIYLNAYPYGTPKYLPIDEEHILDPHSPYNFSKTIAENMLINYLNGITKVISLRVFNIYGLYQSQNFLIPKIISQIKNKKTISLNDLRPKRDFLYVKDLVFLIEKILINSSFSAQSGLFNVGSGRSYKILDIIKIISKIEKENPQVQNKYNFRNNEILNLYADITKVSKTFGWKPSYTIEEGLTDYLREIKLNENK